jgi:putative transcriptional regulator
MDEPVNKPANKPMNRPADKPVSDQGDSLKGQLLLSMPSLSEGPFSRSLIYLCTHDAKGAMGLIVNKPVGDMCLADIFKQCNISDYQIDDDMPLQLGGPVDNQRGFILHSNDYSFNGSLKLDNLSMSSSTEALSQIAHGKQPRRYLIALGYAGWAERQLDKEIQRNMWLNLPFDEELVFGYSNQEKWNKAMEKLGISAHSLSATAGNA